MYCFVVAESGVSVHTGILEDEVSLHGVVLLVHAVLTGGVEVELGELVVAAAGDQSAVGEDDLETRAKVLELDIVGVGDVERDVLHAGIADVLGVDDDGRLAVALGTGGVLLVQTVPVQRAAGSGVVERVDFDDAVGTGEQGGAADARRCGRGEEGEDGSSNLHFEV